MVRHNPRTSKHAEAMQRHRQKKKSDPVEYDKFMKKEAVRLVKYRKQMSPRKRAEYQLKTNERMRHFRLRKKEAAAQEDAVHAGTHETRAKKAQFEKQRQYWRDKKREYRKKMSSQKKRRIKEKDGEAKRKKRNVKKAESLQLMTERRLGGFPSSAAKRKAVWRARIKIPKSAEKYATVVESLIKNASPQKQTQLMKLGIDTSTRMQAAMTSVKTTLASLGKRRQHTFVHNLALTMRNAKYGLKSQVSKCFGVKKHHFSRIPQGETGTRAVRSDALSPEHVQAVQNHFQRCDISTELPNKKKVKNNTPTRVLQRNLDATYESFKNLNPDVVLSRSKFAELRPRSILTQSNAKWVQCLCDYCVNVELKAKVLNSMTSSCSQTCRIRDKYHAAELTMCSDSVAIDTGDRFHKLQCIDRTCSSCGTNKVAEFLEPLFQNTSEHKQVTWQKWGKAEYQGKPKKALLKVQGSLQDLLEELISELESFSAHLFVARWQQVQFTKVIKNPPERSVVIVMDFSENYTCLAQREVQSAHWSQNQLTVHPMVAFYRCEKCPGSPTVREAIDIVSNDLHHDAHAVHLFTKAATRHLLVNRSLDVVREIQWSDGCSSQYKSRTPLMDISYSGSDLNIEVVERNYFGSRHGKNPCDGEGGVIKSAVTRAVKSEEGCSIQDASSFYEFCRQRLTKASTTIDAECNHSRRTFIYLDKSEINRERPQRTNVATLSGTRKIHSAVGLGGGKLNVRRLSCFCAECEDFSSGRKAKCLNAAYTTPRIKRQIKMLKGTHDNKPGDSQGVLLKPTSPVTILSTESVDFDDQNDIPDDQMNIPDDQMDIPDDQMNIPDDQMDIPDDQMDFGDFQLTATEVLQSIEEGLTDVVVPLDDKLNATAEDEQSGTEHKVGDWCIVRYDNTTYPGVVEEVINDEFKVSVMVQCGPVRWRWPDPPDSLWYTKSNVLREIQSPILVSSRGHFEFKEKWESEP